MDGSRARRIEEILRNRATLATRIASAKECVEKQERLLGELERQRFTMSRSFAAGGADEDEVNAALVAKERLDAVGKRADELRMALRAEALELNLLHGRFSRNTLNVGVVGQPRQGKSRLLQSLSGLGPQEIPSAASLPHTAVRSVIRHKTGAVGTTATVTFYSESEFLKEILSPYYDRLYLGAQPASLDDFCGSPLPPLQQNRFQPDDHVEPPEAEAPVVEVVQNRPRRKREIGRARASAEYRSLQSIHSRCAGFRHLISAAARQIEIPGDEILQYVAQHDTKEDEPGAAASTSKPPELSNYLAVRKVEVFRQFPDSHRDVDRIAFVDMPGLGQTVVGDEARLSQMLSDQIDFVLLVKMPPAMGSGWLQADVDLYDIILDSVPEDYLEDFALLVLNHNHQAGDNLKNCIALGETLSASGIRVGDIAIADCSHPDDVRDRVLDPVLDRLSLNLRGLDDSYLEEHRVKLRKLAGDLTSLVGEAREAVDRTQPQIEMKKQLRKLFRSQSEKLAKGLHQLRAERYRTMKHEDERFTGAFARAVTACEKNSGMPSEDEIRDHMPRAQSYGRTYFDFVDRMRTRMTLHFKGLDHPLREMTRECKQQVVDVLINEGGLGPISADRTDVFLRDFVEAARNLRSLRSTIDTLERFELSYWGLVLLQLRRNLSLFVHDSDDFSQLGSEPNEQTVWHLLDQSRASTVERISKGLHEEIESPNMILHAVVDNFMDQLLSDEVQDELEVLYEEHQTKIWSREYKDVERRSELATFWHVRIILPIEEAVACVTL